MKILVATPCYGGMMSSRYFLSAIELSNWFNEGRISHAFFTLENESLIPRGRNICAQYALDNKFDKLLFIDSDIEFKVQDVARLLQSDKFIVGGTYPLKSLPLRLNLNALEEHHETYGMWRDPEAFQTLGRKYGNEKGEVEVRHIPTGFMLIDCAVLRAMTVKRPKYIAPDLTNQGEIELHDFFPTGVRNGIYESEDWGFCSIAREMGFPVFINTKVIVTHIGSHHFSAKNA